MLTKQMSDEIETIQKRACRIIYGYDKPYDQIISDNLLPSLSTRREELTLKFATKCANSARFGDWFPKKEHYEDIVNGHCLRTEKTYREDYARTDRLKNSPVFYMRRQLNNF